MAGSKSGLWAWTLAAVLGLASCGDSYSPIKVSVGSGDPVVDPPPPPPLPNPNPQRQYESCYQPSLTTATTVAGHRCSWWHEALIQQNRLDDDAPLQRSLWLATHNSYNSTAYPGPSSSGDPNHALTLTDQLILDYRGLELDLHWYPHAASGGFAPVLCHALGAETNHLGCASSDRHFRDGLAEVASFLRRPENAKVVLMLDIEDQLQQFQPPNSSSDSPQGHADAIAAINQTLGSLVYRPVQGAGCQPLPLTLTKATVLAAGAQIIITSGCNAAGGWNDWIFDIASVRQQKGNDGFSGPPDCGAPYFAATDYTQRWTRVWHDSTQLGAQTNGSLQAIDATTLSDLIACGIHMPSLDQVRPNDDRAEASIWSWAVNQPAPRTGPACAQMQTDGRFHSQDCGTALPVACRDGDGWLLSSPGLPQQGQSLCTLTKAGSRFDRPETGADARKLQAALNSQTAVWLDYFDPRGQGDWRRISP